MRKLTDEETKELKEIKFESENSDMKFLDRLEEIYKDDAEASEKIEFLKGYLASLEAIPYDLPCHYKTQRSFSDALGSFCGEIGFSIDEGETKEWQDSLAEKIAEKFGIDIDINGDGVTSFEAYRKKKAD